MKALNTLQFVIFGSFCCLIGYALNEFTPKQEPSLTNAQLEQIVEAAQFLEHK